MKEMPKQQNNDEVLLFLHTLTIKFSSATTTEIRWDIARSGIIRGQSGQGEGDAI
jgi:hypothetical protein